MQNNSIDISKQPSWLELPEEQKQKHTYWVCRGTDVPKKENWLKKIFKKEKEKEKLWRVIYHSKEEAEADASFPNDFWEWNGKEATPITLQSVIFEARRKKDFGVIIKGYKDGKWVTLKKYPSHEPLLND